MNGHEPIAQLTVFHGGNLEISDGHAADPLVASEFERTQPRVSASRTAVEIRYTWLPRIGWLLRRREPSARLTLARDRRWVIRLSGGVGRVRADLRRIEVDEVVATGGARSLEFWLDAPGSIVPILVDGSVGAITVHRPPAVPVRLRVSGAVASAEIDSHKSGARSGGNELTAGVWPGSTAGWDIEVRGDLARVAIDSDEGGSLHGVAPNDAHVRLPPWLGVANRVIIGLQRLGMSIGTMHTLTVVGRRSGLPRTTPVSPLTVDGHQYLVSIPGTEWVRNARVSGTGVLARGRRRQTVRLVEVDQADRVPILRSFPKLVPHGVQFFVMTGVVAAADPDAFAAAAPRCAVFRVVPIE